MSNSLFSLGRIVATRGAIGLGVNLMPYINQHAKGHWGDVCQEDWQENDLSVKEGYRILSSYQISEDVKIWIITESDRSATTVLLPDEY